MKFSFHGGLNLLFLTDLMDIDEVFNIFEIFFFLIAFKLKLTFKKIFLSFSQAKSNRKIVNLFFF